MSMIQIPVLFPENLYKALKTKSKIEQKPMADFIRKAVEKDLKKAGYRSPLLTMVRQATGSKKVPKKDYSLKVDEVLYGKG